MSSRGTRRAARRPADRRRVRRALSSARIRAALGLGLVLSLGATGTFAHWTDAASVSGATFTGGTIDLKLNGSDNPTGYVALNIANMVPGNSMAAVISVTSSGTAPLKYTSSATATNADSKNLRGSLVVKLTNGTVSGTSPSMTCSGTAIASSGTTLNGPMIVTPRLVNPGTPDSLCIQVTLDALAPTALQGATTSVIMNFSATSDLS